MNLMILQCPFKFCSFYGRQEKAIKKAFFVQLEECLVGWRTLIIGWHCFL